MVHRKHHHGISRTLVHLNRKGAGSVKVAFSQPHIKFVSVTLVNTSTEFHGCGKGSYSCQGSPDAAHPAFAVKLIAFKA